MELLVGKAKVRLFYGDITEQEVDAKVNAANPSLMEGGGVDGAIRRKGGPRINEECRRIRETMWPCGLLTGSAVITSGGDLKARHVIHTVGPIWRGGDNGEPDLLAEAYENSLRLAASRGLKTVAFPSISTGAYGYLIEDAAKVALRVVRDFLLQTSTLEEVTHVLYAQRDNEAYKRVAKKILRRS